MSATTHQLPSSVHMFAQLLSSTRRGARLARLLAAEQLRGWPVPPDAADRVELVVAELAANAALHGCAPGRDFRLTLMFDAATRTLRVEVTDSRRERSPLLRPEPRPDEESGRGLLLVAALADRWGTEPYPPSGKTVWAECDCQSRAEVDLPDLGGSVLDDDEIKRARQ